MVSVQSEVATKSIILGEVAKAEKKSGKLASQYYPGAFLYQSATDIWTENPGSGKCYVRGGFLEFPMRTSATLGEVDIDTIVSDGTARNCEIVTGPLDGTIKIAALCEDLSADKYYGEPLCTTSGGALSLYSGNLSATIVAIVSEDGYTNGDTIVKCYLV